MVGPGRATSSWDAPLRKYIERARVWGRLGLGLFLSLQAYRVYISSVLQFVAQLEDLPPDFLVHEQRACQLLLPGPTCWMVSSCLRDLRSFSFPSELPDLGAIAAAAKARVVRFENATHGGLRVQERASRLRDLLPSPACSLAHAAWRGSWAPNCFLFKLAGADSDLQRRVALLPGGGGLDLSVRCGWQGRATNLYRESRPIAAYVHLRRRLDRWILQTFPGRRVERALVTVQVLGRSAAPRVQATYLRTRCDGWCTRRRRRAQ